MNAYGIWRNAACAGLLLLSWSQARATEGVAPAAPARTAVTAPPAAKQLPGWLRRLGIGVAASAPTFGSCGDFVSAERGQTLRLKDAEGRAWIVAEAHVPGLTGVRWFLCADGDWIRFGRGERILAVRRLAERRSIEVLTRNRYRGGAIDYWMLPGRDSPAEPGAGRVVDPAELDTGWARLDLEHSESDPRAAWAAAVVSRLPTERPE